MTSQSSLEPVWGTPMIESWSVPKGTIAAVDNVLVVHPRDMLIQRGKGRLPWESRMTLGYREMERDRRRHG